MQPFTQLLYILCKQPKNILSNIYCVKQPKKHATFCSVVKHSIYCVKQPKNMQPFTQLSNIVYIV